MSSDKPDLVGTWTVSLSDGVHVIEFEHGTTTGKRVLHVDGKEALRRDWMFKLVGKEHFTLGTTKAKCAISIDSVSGFAYEYSLEVNGKSLEKFRENQSRIMKTWLLTLGEGQQVRVVLEKDTMDVWCNGQRQDTAGEFTDDGTETHFELGAHQACIKAVSSGNKREGILHVLLIDGQEIPESAE